MVVVLAAVVVHLLGAAAASKHVDMEHRTGVVKDA